MKVSAYQTGVINRQHNSVFVQIMCCFLQNATKIKASRHGELHLFFNQPTTEKIDTSAMISSVCYIMDLMTL